MPLTRPQALAQLKEAAHLQLAQLAESAEDVWLQTFEQPSSVIFNRTPKDFDVLLKLIQQKRIVPSGAIDAGGHALYQTVKASSGSSGPVAGDPDSFTPAEFVAAAEKFVAAWQAHTDEYMRKRFPNNPKETIGVDKGPKYWRIWKASVGADGKVHSKSVVGFIDKTTGFLLKAHGWKAPAKGPRGDVFKDSPSKWQTPYSIS